MSLVLVTGGTGFTGSHLVTSLVADGEQVRVLTRNAGNARSAVPPDVELMEGDLADPATAPRAVQGARVVYHLAGSFRETSITDDRHRAIQVEGTRHLLDAAAAEGIDRFVHTSTIGVLGHIPHPPADETAPYSPGDIYQETKVEGERLALETHARTGLPVTVIRPATIYGPGDMRFLKLFKAIKRRIFAMLGSGKVLLHPVFISDLVAGFRLAAREPNAIGEIFIVGGGENVTLNDFARAVASEVQVPEPRLHLPVSPFQLAGTICEKLCIPLGIKPPIFRRRVDFFTKSRGFTIDKARRLLGYEPRVPLREGLSATAAWYRSLGYL